MRVLYLNPFSQEVSGPDESLLTLLRSLTPLGIEPYLVLPRPGPQVSRYESLGVRVRYAPLTILTRRMSPLRMALLAPQLCRGVASIVQLVRGEQIDLIHTNMEVVLDGSIASRMAGMPHVLHYRGNTNDEPKFAFDLLARFWTATADRVFCISHATAEIFRKRGLGDKIRVLYNPIDVDAFEAAERVVEVRRELGAGPDDCLIGTVGRIHPRKDVVTFLRAAALVAEELPHARFVIVGSAEGDAEVRYSNSMRGVATSLGLGDRLTWTGARRDVARVLKAMDVFVLCSRNEGFGRVLAEAMAAGVAAVASDEGAPRELSAGGRCALLAQPAEPRSFASQITALARDPEKRHHMIEEARRASRAFAADAIAREVRDAYGVLLGGILS